MLKGKKVLIGITGSIAAYKTILLVRDLKKLGAEVQVVCTPAALDFVTPTTLATLSGNPVHSQFVPEPLQGTWTNHVELGKWADLFVIAPLTASTLSKMADGQCDNLLIATYLSSTCPVWVAPAMDLDMYSHAATKSNLEILGKRGVGIIEAASGSLASGLVGQGRMEEPEVILDKIRSHFEPKSALRGRHVLITAGPTIEKIDPVRFISNYSSGKMGYALAEASHERGALVTLISGPAQLPAPQGIHEFLPVHSAAEMLGAVKEHFLLSDILIMAAAVADYTPKAALSKKHKKGTGFPLELEPTEDILAYCGQHKTHQRVIGFALETDNEVEFAREKLVRKNADMIVLNSLNDIGAGFGTDTNKVTFIFADKEVPRPLQSKKEVANDILDQLETLL